MPLRGTDLFYLRDCGLSSWVDCGLRNCIFNPGHDVYGRNPYMRRCRHAATLVYGGRSFSEETRHVTCRLFSHPLVESVYMIVLSDYLYSHDLDDVPDVEEAKAYFERIFYHQVRLNDPPSTPSEYFGRASAYMLAAIACVNSEFIFTCSSTTQFFLLGFGTFVAMWQYDAFFARDPRTTSSTLDEDEDED